MARWIRLLVGISAAAMVVASCSDEPFDWRASLVADNGDLAAGEAAAESHMREQCEVIEPGGVTRLSLVSSAVDLFHVQTLEQTQTRLAPSAYADAWESGVREYCPERLEHLLEVLGFESARELLLGEP